MLLAVGSALLVLAFSFNMYRLRSKRKLLESQNQLYELREMAADFKEHKSTHRDALLYQLSIMKQVKVLHSYFLKEDKEKTIVKKINEAVFGNENGDNWNGFYKIIDELCDGFLYRVKERFTELDESEFRVICLTCFDFHNKEIAAFMELSVDTIQLRKKNIRRKLDIGQRGDIIAFMKEKLGENKAR